MEWKHERILTLILIAVAGAATVALGDRGWWIMPPAVFIGAITMMLVDRRRPLTIWLVLLTAALAIALGAFLKFFPPPLRR